MTNREGGSNDKKDDKPPEFDRDSIATDGSLGTTAGGGGAVAAKKPCIALQAKSLFQELGVTASQHRMIVEQEGAGGRQSPQHANVSTILSHYLRTSSEVYHSSEEDCRFVPMEGFERFTKELCNLPTFFHKPLYKRILLLWEKHLQENPRQQSVKLPPLPLCTYGIFHYFWEMEMAPYDE